MRLTVFSHKLCWPSDASPTGYATSGGFPFQMAALSDLFDSTSLVVPVQPRGNRVGEIPLTGHNVSIIPLSSPTGSGIRRHLGLLIWLITNGLIIFRQALRADAVHVPIPSDIGAFGMVLAYLLRKPLYVRHCGNWDDLSTPAKHFWRWFMERASARRHVMLATGGAPNPPSARNPRIEWIFSSSLTDAELATLSTATRSAPQSPRLIIACRQEREKGASIVIDALPHLVGKYPTIHLDIVGDGTILEELKEQSARLGLNQQITFHGRVPHEQVLHLMRSADLFCYPTQASEGFPKVVLEAMASGLPVITTRVSVLPQLIGDCAGLLLDEAAPQPLAQAIMRLLDDPALYCSTSACASQTAQGYSLEAWAEFIEKRLTAAWGSLKDTL